MSVPLPTTAAAWQAPLRACLGLLLALLLSALPGPVQAQRFAFRVFGQTEGLSNLSVTCLHQDHTGYVWICTENGLFRHDGTDFERFGTEQGIRTSLIHTVLEDHDGRLWVGTLGGLFVGHDGHFQEVRSGGHPIDVDSGSTLAETGPGHVVVIGHEHLFRVSAASDRSGWQVAPAFTAAEFAAQPALAHLSSVFAAGGGRLWLGCGEGLCEQDQDGVRAWGGAAGVPTDTWMAFRNDHEGRLWVRGQKHLVMLAPGARRFQSMDPPHARLEANILTASLDIDREGRVLVRTGQGIARWQDGRWEEFTTAHGLPGLELSTLMVDREGSPWIGMAGQGLAYWLGYGQAESWTSAQGLGGDPVWTALRTQDGRLLVGTRAGCRRIPAAADRAMPCGIAGIPAGEVQVMEQAQDGTLWMGMTTGELLRVAPGSGHAELAATVPLMRRLLVDSRQDLWICTSTGLLRLRQGTRLPERLTLPEAVGEITDAAEDAQGRLWFASQGGALLWSGDGLRRIPVEDERARAGFTELALAAQGWLWMGGSTSGIARVHFDGQRLDQVEWMDDPIVAHAAIMFVRVDPSRGWLWVGTDEGLAMFDGAVWRRFSTQDGLIWNDTNQNSFLAEQDGTVWIGTSGGLTHILHPDRLAQALPLNLRIDKVTLGGNPVDLTALPLDGAESGSGFDAHLSVFDFGDATHTVVKTRLRGLSDSWVVTRQHDLHYPGLRPGHYHFEVVANDRDRGRSSAMANLEFEVRPAWYESAWFKGLLALGLTAALAALWQHRERKVRAHKLALERRLQEHAELLRKATRDALTGVWNRQAITDLLARHIEDARAHDTPLAVAIIDIDHFKRINDTYGHPGGDAVLQAVAHALCGALRAGEEFGRLGGEEFLLVAPGLAEPDPENRMETLRALLASLVIPYEGQEIRLSASFGLAWLAAREDASTALLGRADRALYAAKHAGRNRVCHARGEPLVV